MKIGGFKRFSLIDYPDKISAIIFTQGCNFRCPYCHNPELVKPELFKNSIPEEEVLSFLETRKRLIEGVVITGGEPLLREDIIDFLKDIKRKGYLIKLDTNGSNPAMLEKLLKEGLLEYIAIDFKASLKAYKRITRVNMKTQDIIRSIELLRSSGIPYEIRTTVFNGLSLDNLIEMMTEVHSLGVKNYFLQMFVPWPGCRKNLFPADINVDYLFQNLTLRFQRYGIRNIKDGLYHYVDNR